MKAILSSAVLLSVIMLVSCKNKKEETINEVKNAVRLKITSTSFDSGKTIPDTFTCAVGQQIFPNVSWNDNGKAAKSYVLIMDDPDAIPVVGYVWNHWLLYDIPANVKSIGKGTNTYKPLPTGTIRGVTSFGDTTYGGPCPPSGQLHRYFIKLYQIDIPSLELGKSANVATVRNKMKGHILDSAEYMGTFQQ